MKKLLFLLFIFSHTLIFANPALDAFIDQQIEVERQLIDNNISVDKKMEIKKLQSEQYREFFIQYAADREIHLLENDPYKHRIYKLKLRKKMNEHRGNKNAALRDELLLKNIKFRSDIRNGLNNLLRITDNNSQNFFKNSINQIVTTHFSSYKPIDKKRYTPDANDVSSPIVSDLLKALDETILLEYIANTFSAELIENSTNIYRIASLSGSKIFTFANKINNIPFAKTMNIYLSKMNIDAARIIMILLIIIFIIVTQKIIYFMTNRFLKHKKLKDDDTNYIHKHITKIFNMITSLIILHLIIVVVIGFDSTTFNISKLFAIAYVILTTLLLYRITNTIAYLKQERIKNSLVLRNEIVNLAIKVINGLLILLATMAILKIVGVDLTAVLSGLGIAGAAVAFAAKDSIANVFGSIAILAGDIFEQGDWIETANEEGTVVEIGLRATTIRTFDNALISVPNVELSNSSVKNWTRRRIGRRIKMNIGVTYESDFSDIKQAIQEIKEMLREHPGIANEHTTFMDAGRQSKLVSIEDLKDIKRITLVYMDEFASSSINILVYCFSRTVDWAEWLEAKEDVMFKIAHILKQNKLEFAYPTMMIYKGEGKKEE
ncbi:MAG TPA: mechanosensitive ion channel family protein [Sulfurovum sp.]|nr:mechanosensitive ion channel family protein [Sulfurovum sp.]